MTVEIRPLTCTYIDFRSIIRRSAVADRPDACETLADFYRRSSYTWIGVADDIVACIWGLIPPTILSDRAYLWMLTTDLVDEHKFIFVRYSRLAMDEMLKHYPTIVGHVEATQTRSIRWLRWLGARYGNPQGKMIPFWIEAHG